MLHLRKWRCKKVLPVAPSSNNAAHLAQVQFKKRKSSHGVVQLADRTIHSLLLRDQSYGDVSKKLNVEGFNAHGDGINQRKEMKEVELVTERKSNPLLSRLSDSYAQVSETSHGEDQKISVHSTTKNVLPQIQTLHSREDFRNLLDCSTLSLEKLKAIFKGKREDTICINCMSMVSSGEVTMSNTNY